MIKFIPYRENLYICVFDKDVTYKNYGENVEFTVKKGTKMAIKYHTVDENFSQLVKEFEFKKDGENVEYDFEYEHNSNNIEIYAIGHTVKIECPNCSTQQTAFVEYNEPFNSYVHTCEKCNYIITESEWMEI